MSRESFSKYCDMIPFIILKAPDRFPTDLNVNLEIAFFDLNLNYVESKDELGHSFEEIGNRIVESLDYYRKGDMRNGIKSLQAVENIMRKEKLIVI